jgi:hypothetical protein
MKDAYLRRCGLHVELPLMVSMLTCVRNYMFRLYVSMDLYYVAFVFVL